MNTIGGRISGTRLATLLGEWRRGSRQGAVALASAIELQVLDGHLPVGTQLPAERELAEALGASRTLIGAALDRLREGGLVASKRGSGSWITSPSTGASAPIFPAETEDIDMLCGAGAAAPGVMTAVDAARRQLVDQIGLNGYGERGLLVLREQLARHYTERGLPTTPAQILVTNGAHHAFSLALRMLADPGDRVLVEQPTYPNALEAIRGAHALPVPVALGEDGWDFDGIEAALRQASPRLAYLVLDFQNPTGLRMDDEGRERLAGILARARTPVVVDETLVELDYSDVPAPKPFSAGDWSILVGSSSKSYWGGLRIGWLRAAEDVITRLTSARFGLDLGSPVFEQLVLTELLKDEELLARRRAELKQQRDALAAAVREHCPEWTFRLPEGGFWLWCRLPEPMSSRLAVAAAGQGVQLAPGSRFGAHGGLERWMRLPYSMAPSRMDEAMRRIALAAASVSLRDNRITSPVT